MNWREWIFAKLSSDASLQTIVGDRIYSTVKGNPDVPFVVIRFAPSTPQIVAGEFQDMTVWVHDQPGSYVTIDTALKAIRAAIIGPVYQDEGIMVDWLGDSGDLADDARGTVLRNASFRLVGRRAA